MALFAPGIYAQGICGRCGMRKPYRELRMDGNIPELYVCSDDGCYDELDPYKLPPALPDAYILHHPRPDIPLVNNAYSLLVPDGEQFLDNEEVFIHP